MATSSLRTFAPRQLVRPMLGFAAVGAVVDDLRRRLAGDGPVHLVLDGLEELQC